MGPGDIEVVELSMEAKVGDETSADVSACSAAESAGLERKSNREALLDDATDVSVCSAAQGAAMERKYKNRCIKQRSIWH